MLSDKSKTPKSMLCICQKEKYNIHMSTFLHAENAENAENAEKNMRM